MTMPQEANKPDTMADIAHQLTRIANHMTSTGETTITCEQATAAWEQAGMRIYYDAFTDALGYLNIKVV